LIRRKIVRGLGLSHARVVSGGGAATPVEIINWYRKLGVNFIEGYGMTETGITHVPLPGKFRVGFVGQASRYADTRISAEGEVQIKGPMNMLGYYRNAELTREAFTQDGYFRTGDRGEIDALGRLRLVGRLKEEFKTSKGKYVAPAQIEKRLSLFTLFESVAVFGAGMTAPFAMAVLVPGMREECQKQERRAQVESQMSAVLDDVNAQLEHHEHLRFLVLCQQTWSVESGLLTPTLKVRRPLLEQRFGQRFNEWEEAQLKVIWVDAP
jgi:long-subunit acyl-CoA synthetase (AMP-forming)